jgi:hypothetical protein
MTGDAERSRTVRRTVDAPATAVFAVLADPGRHPELDGSGTVSRRGRGLTRRRAV